MTTTIVDAFALQLGLDLTTFKKGQRELDDSWKKTKDSSIKNARAVEDSNKALIETFGKLRNEAIGFFAALAGARGVKEFVTSLTAANVALGNFAANIGESPQMLAAWGNALERIGGNAGEAATSLGSLAKSFYNLKYNGQALPAEVYRVFAMARMPVPSRSDSLDGFLNKTAIALQSIAKQDRTAAFFFGEGMGLTDGMVNLMLKYGAATSRYVKSLEPLSPSNDAIEASKELNESWFALSQTTQALATSIATAIEPAIVSLLDQFRKWIEANREWIQTGIVDAIHKFVDWVKSIDWQAFANGVSQFGAAAKTVVDALGGIKAASEELFALWATDRALKFLGALGAIGAVRGAAGAGAGVLATPGGALAVPLLLGGDTNKPDPTPEQRRSAKSTEDAYRDAHGGFWHQLYNSIFGDAAGGSDSKAYNDFETRRARALGGLGRRPAAIPAPPAAPRAGAPASSPQLGAGQDGVLPAPNMRNPPRNLRNRNPGNVIDGAWARRQPGYAGSDGHFAIFDSMENGYRAANRNLDAYANRGVITPAAILRRWAPASSGEGNDPAAYAARVQRLTGLDPNQPLGGDPLSRARMLRGITEVEGGVSSPYDFGQISGALGGPLYRRAPAWWSGVPGIEGRLPPSGVPLSSIQNNYPVTTSSSSNSVHYGTINVNVPAGADHYGIAKSVQESMERFSFAMQFQSGQV